MPLPGLSINDVSATEGDSGTTDFTFTISLSAAAAANVTVNYATSSDSATSGTDFNAASGTATIIAGDTSTTVTVQVIGDTDLEINETFFVTLSSPSANATIADAILDRLVHNAYRIELSGESLRKQRTVSMSDTTFA